MHKTEITNALIKDNKIKTNVQLVANTYLNITFESLTKKLSLLNSQLNRNIFRYYYKFPDKKIMFICNHERVRDNVHSHITLRIPKPDKIKDQSKYDQINVVLQMKQIWEQMNPKYRLYYDFNIKNLVGKVIYDFKRFFNRRPTLDDPESKSFVII